MPATHWKKFNDLVIKAKSDEALSDSLRKIKKKEKLIKFMENLDDPNLALTAVEAEALGNDLDTLKELDGVINPDGHFWIY